MSVLLIGADGQLGTAFQYEMKKQKIDYFAVDIDVLISLDCINIVTDNYNIQT